MANSRFSCTKSPLTYPSSEVRKRIRFYFIPLANQVERLLLLIVAVLFIGLVFAQIFIISFPEHRELVSKTVQYEGIFRQDPVESKATLQHK